MLRACKTTLLGLATLLLAAATATAANAPPPLGGLTQVPGPAGCFANAPAAGSCQLGTGMFNPDSAVISPDGKFVYVDSNQFNGGTAGLSAFARNPVTGRLTQLAGTGGVLHPRRLEPNGP